VTVHTRYNFSCETVVELCLVDYDKWVPIVLMEVNLSGTGNESFVFYGLTIPIPEKVIMATLVRYKNESEVFVPSDAFYFHIVALNFTIDNLKLPSTVKSNEIFNVTIEISYNVAPMTNITLAIYDRDAGKYIAIYDRDAGKYTARSWNVLSGSNNQTFNLSLTASASADMNLTLVPYFTYEFVDEKIQGLIEHRNFTVNVIDYWIAAAEYFIGSLGVDGTGIPMSASDGAFDSAAERVTARVPIEDLTTGSHTLYVHGMDSQGNWGKATLVVLDVTCPITISDMDYPAEAMLYNPLPVTVNTVYSFGSETKAKISIYNRDTGQLLASSYEKALSGSGSELFRLDPLTGSLGVLNLTARVEYYLDKEQKWVSRDSSDFSINVTSPFKITNLQYLETVKQYSFFHVKGNINYSVSEGTKVMVSLYDRDREEEVDNTAEMELIGTDSKPFPRLDANARSVGTMNLSVRVYYLDDKQNWIFCDSSDFSISVDQP